jgi:hypothetical protein
MKDRYGREFKKEDIRNSDQINLVEKKALDEYTREELHKQAVLITDPDGGKRLYLISELQEILKANGYCRLKDPMTHVDILSQVPEFQDVIEFEENAAHYNAFILDENPEFILLLTTYVKEVLNVADVKAGSGEGLEANKSKELDEFYQKLANMPDEKREAFFSLFCTNRKSYLRKLPSGEELLTLPAKWQPAPNNFGEYKLYQWAIKEKKYKPYPHRNVRAGDFITDPQESCTHSWGMDVLHMLLEYHIGRNIPFSVFDRNTNEDSFNMEQFLSAEIQKNLNPGSLDPDQGAWFFEKAKEAVSRDLSTVEILNCNDWGLIRKLNKECCNYMKHLLAQMPDFPEKKQEKYPKAGFYSVAKPKLILKYLVVLELYEVLNDRPGISGKRCIQNFIELYQQGTRQKAIAMHRDNLGVRLLNAIASILSLGIKNLITYGVTKGHFGFWNSRGRTFNEQVEKTLNKYNKLS